MTRQAIIAVVVGVIIVLGAIAAFLYSRTSLPPAEQAVEVNQEETEPENGMSMETITDLLSKGENTRCTFNSETQEGTTAGTVYISGENARGDFETTTDEDTISTYMIRNGDTFYMWGDSLKTGIKMVMNINEWADAAESAQSLEGENMFDPNAQVDFKCTSWTVDSSLFTAPTSVKFISFEGMMGPTGTTEETETSESTNQTGGIQCSLCDSLSGDAQNLCLQNCQ